MRTFSSHQVCRIAGITYRQLDYWIRVGCFEPHIPPGGGSGSRRVFPQDTIETFAAVGQLAAFTRSHASPFASGGGGVSTTVISRVTAAVMERPVDPAGELLIIGRGDVERRYLVDTVDEPAVILPLRTLNDILADQSEDHPGNRWEYAST